MYYYINNTKSLNGWDFSENNFQAANLHLSLSTNNQVLLYSREAYISLPRLRELVENE